MGCGAFQPTLDADDDAALRQARQMVARDECRRRGHDWEMIFILGQESPYALVCDRGCGVGMAKVSPPEPAPESGAA